MPEGGRVVAGIARGLRLAAPGEGTRPLSDRVKQTLFGILDGGALVAWPVAFLDLFAGSGAGGIEALSRGAPRAVLVERDGGACRVIQENLRRTGLAERATVVQEDVLRYLDGDATAAAGPFGVALLDPPYGDAAMLPALERLGDPDRGWLAPRAAVVAKHFWRDAPPDRVGRLVRTRERRFGETALTFYHLEDA